MDRATPTGERTPGIDDPRLQREPRKRTRRHYKDPIAPAVRELTPRQKTIVALIANGLTNKQIAKHLGIAVKTIECHRSAAMDRLGLASAAHLVRYAVRTGLVEK